MNINWYPGHMKKTKESIKKSLSLVDIVYEVIDARIPFSSQNPDIDKILGNKPRLIILNKSDLADCESNRKWQDYFKRKGGSSVLVDCIKNKGLEEVVTSSYKLTEERRKNQAKKGIKNRPIRVMIVGIPNVGKSTLINSLSKRRGTRVGNRPGVTKANQWVRIRGDLELLDTPGVLWPKFEDKDVGLNLAFTGAIKDELLDIENLAVKLIEKLNLISKTFIEERYNILVEDKSPYDILVEIGQRRGCVIRGGEIDFAKASYIILDEFRKGVLGRISLELPEL